MELVLSRIEHLEAFGAPPELLGNSECFVEDGEVLAIVAFVDLGGCVEIGFYLSERLRGMPVRLHRTALRYLSGIRSITSQSKFHSFRYLTAIVKPGDERACRWIERLGFRYEGMVFDGMRYVRMA